MPGWLNRTALRGGRLVLLGLASVLVVLLAGAALVAGALGAAWFLHRSVLHASSIPMLTTGLVFFVVLLLGGWARSRSLDGKAERLLRLGNGPGPKAPGAINRSAVPDTVSYRSEIQN